ncbi:oligosaccharide flippase family protein, partial [Bradyrhizobium ottawaense]
MNSPETFRPAKPHSATRHLFRSVPWVVLEAGFNVVHGLSSVFAIGLLVPPGELGKASVALSTVLFIESFTSMGLQEAVIRSRSGDTITTDTAFCLALCFALAGVLLATIAAFPLGYLYDDYQITSLLLSSSSLLPLNALTLVPAAKLARKLRGGTLTKRMILGKFAGLATLFLFGLLGAGAWAVVVSAIATSAGGLFVLTLFATRFPRLRFDRP